MLRPYQKQVRRDLFAELREGKKRIAVCMPTGAGKTRLAAQLIKDANSKGKKALFLVHLRTLVRQASVTFSAQGLNVGIMQAENTSYNEAMDDVIVASIQTLARRKAPDTVSLIIIDECHVLFKKHIELMEKWNALTYIGLSATPTREDLGKYFEALVNGPSVKELTEIGALVPVKAYHPHPAKVAEVRSKLRKSPSPHGGTDFKQKDMMEKMGTAKVVGDIVESWKSRGENRPTIVFAISKSNSRFICEMFAQEGIASAHIDDGTPEAERAEMFKDFESGKIKVVCSVGVLAIGFDAPWVSCVILARCTASESYHMQQVGRGLRAHPGKTDCIILDHTGNLIEHGMPEEYSVEALCANDRAENTPRKRKKKIAACHGCGATMDATVRTCPECGADRFGRGKELKVIDGELVEAAEIPEKERALSVGARRSIYLQLLWYARENGYKDGWAYMKYREFNDGMKPRWSWKELEPIMPGPKMTRWIKSQQIAWVKSRHNRRPEFA